METNEAAPFTPASAVNPGMFSIGSVPAVRHSLARLGWSIAAIGRLEINEASAAIARGVLRGQGLSEDVVNV